MVRLVATAMAVALLTACASTEATPAAGPSGGQASLQSPPFTEPKFVAPPGQPTKHVAPPPLVDEAANAAASTGEPFAAIASQFDPARQRFVWVLPPGVHGKGPWDMKSVIKHRDEVKFETSVPLKAVVSAGGERPEYPRGYEIVRLTDDGSWAARTAEIDKVIDGLIQQYGRGQGSLEMTSEIHFAIDQDYREAYCVANKQPDVHMYLEETGVQDLIQLDVAEMADIIQLAVQKACER